MGFFNNEAYEIARWALSQKDYAKRSRIYKVAERMEIRYRNFNNISLTANSLRYRNYIEIARTPTPMREWELNR